MHKRRHYYSPCLSDRALEMIMRDVLDGLEELALGSSLGSGQRGCEVLSIEPRPGTSRTRPAPGDRGTIVDFFRYKKAV